MVSGLGTGDKALLYVVITVALTYHLPLLIGIVAFAALIALGIYYLHREKTFWKRHGVPQPTANLFFGNTMDYKIGQHEIDLNYAKLLGKTYG
ncbi:hypothetical protein AAVH_36079, partial [Aphelenchoides avenae]